MSRRPRTPGALILLRAVALGALALVAVAPRAAQAQRDSHVGSYDAEPIRAFADPEKDLPPRGTKLKVIGIGTAFTLTFYGAALGSSYLWADDPGADDLRIPVVGPWMKVGQTKLCSDIPDATSTCSDFLQVFGAVWAGIDGLGQIGGLALLTSGFFLRDAGSKKAVRGAGGFEPSRFAARRLEPPQTTVVAERPTGPLLWKVGTARMRPTPMSPGAGSSFGLGVAGVF